jgi:IS30 family transposase
MSDKDAKKHWETIGKKEGRLPNKILFDEKYPNFNIKEWVKTNDKYVLTSKYEIYGWVYMEEKKNYKKYLKLNSCILNDKKIKSNKNSNIKFKISNKIEDLDEIIKKYNISKLSISKALEHFEKRFLNKYNLFFCSS